MICLTSWTVFLLWFNGVRFTLGNNSPPVVFLWWCTRTKLQKLCLCPTNYGPKCILYTITELQMFVQALNFPGIFFSYNIILSLSEEVPIVYFNHLLPHFLKQEMMGCFNMQRFTPFISHLLSAVA